MHQHVALKPRAVLVEDHAVRRAPDRGLGGVADGDVAGAGRSADAKALAIRLLCGAAGGAIIGANTAPAPRCARVAYDDYGDRVCVRHSLSGY